MEQSAAEDWGWDPLAISQAALFPHVSYDASVEALLFHAEQGIRAQL